MTTIAEKSAYKNITFIIDNVKKNISYADRKCNNYSYTKRSTLGERQRERERERERESE